MRVSCWFLRMYNYTFRNKFNVFEWKGMGLGSTWQGGGIFHPAPAFLVPVLSFFFLHQWKKNAPQVVSFHSCTCVHCRSWSTLAELFIPRYRYCGFQFTSVPPFPLFSLLFSGQRSTGQPAFNTKTKKDSKNMSFPSLAAPKWARARAKMANSSGPFEVAMDVSTINRCVRSGISSSRESLTASTWLRRSGI